VFKVEGTDFGTRSDVLKAKNTIIKTFDLVKMFYKTFDLMTKIIKIFDLVPKFIKTFDLVVRTSEIQSSDHFTQ
jgi:hypothetical protein